MSDDYDDCICAEWDGKGWSVCGVPCMKHITVKELDEGIVETEKFIEESKNSEDRIVKALADNMKGRLQTLRAFRNKLVEPGPTPPTLTK
jgi:hypothetical protein